MSAKAKPRNPSELNDADLPTMTEEEQALYLEANAHRLDEIFDTEHPVDFVVPDEATTTISIRLKSTDLRELSTAAEAREMKLSTFIRESALVIARNPRAKEMPNDAAILDQKLIEVMKGMDDVAGLLGVATGKSWTRGAASKAKAGQRASKLAAAHQSRERGVRG